MATFQLPIEILISDTTVGIGDYNVHCVIMYISVSIGHVCTEPMEGPRAPLGRGASRMLRGLMLRMKEFFLVFFNVFIIFVKIFVHNEIH